MAENKQCVVVMPVYKPLTIHERLSLEQALRMTEGFARVLVAPQSFVMDNTYGNLLPLLDIIRFEDSFFSSINDYNRLMLSTIFYDTFDEYQYLLIHQPDAYLFKSELKYWCDKGYDYVGAPWFYPNISLGKRIKTFILKHYPSLFSPKRQELYRHFTLWNHVGNGGLSLRKISSFKNVLQNTPVPLLSRYTESIGTEYNEDIFWAIEASVININFSIPEWREALDFSFENNPHLAYNLKNNILPFGCHAFNVHGTNFWREHIPFLK